MPSIEEAIGKYVELRDRIAEIGKRHTAELAPLSDAMKLLEGFFAAQMAEVGCDSFKTAQGTAFKKNSNSVTMQDPIAFKEHVFIPAAEAIYHYLCAIGFTPQQADLEAIKSMLQTKVRWDMVDFRAGKKGVLEYLEENSVLPPGVNVETVSVVQVRRA